MESPGRNLICAPANILSFWLFFATAVYHSVNSRCLCQFICSPIPRMKPIDNSMAYVYTVWEVWFCEPHVCFVFVESFTFIVFFPSLFFHITLISYRLLLKPLRATPWRCLSSLTSHLILSRPIRSVLICSLNHNHHTNTHTHTHACTLTQCRLQSHHIHASLRPLVCLKKWALMILLLFYCCVKPKVQLYKGSGTSACVTAHERGAFGISLWFPWSFQLWTLNFLWSLKV